MSVGAAAYTIFKAIRLAGSAAEEVADRRQVSADMVAAALLAIGALALAFKKAGDATTKVAEAF